MALPRVIEEQAKLADDLIAKTASQETAPVAQEQPPAAPAPAADTPPEVRPPAMPDAEHKDYEQRYRVLQGKYNAEVVRVQHENKRLNGELDALRAEIAALKEKISAAEETTKLGDIKPEEVEQYGEEFVNFVQRVARAQVPNTIDMQAVEQRLKPVEEVAVRAAKNEFFRSLSAAAPNWESLNTDARFLDWLAEEDPLTGVQRQILFDDAYRRLDVNRCAAFFNAFGGDSVGAANTALPSVREQVVPKTGSPPVPQPPTKRVWTQKEVSDFYDRVRRNEISAEEAARIEQDIFTAQREKRIR